MRATPAATATSEHYISCTAHSHLYTFFNVPFVPPLKTSTAGFVGIHESRAVESYIGSILFFELRCYRNFKFD